MEKIQKDINASMRAILIDMLVEVAALPEFSNDIFLLIINYSFILIKVIQISELTFEMHWLIKM